MDAYLEWLTLTARKGGVRVLALPSQAAHEWDKMLHGQDIDTSDWLYEKVLQN